MQFDLHRVFVAISASLAAALCFVSLRAEDRDTKPANVPADSAARELDDESPIILPMQAPLDLTDLLRSLGVIPALEDAPPANRDAVEVSVIDSLERVQLVGVDEPIIIGSGETTQPKNAEKPNPASRPANPLRSKAEKPEKTEGAITGKPQPPSPKPNSDDETIVPLKLPEDEDQNIPKLSDADKTTSDKTKANSTKSAPDAPPLTLGDEEASSKVPESSINSKATSNTTQTNGPTEPPGVRPKPKMVVVKPIGADEQESPRLANLPREMDAKQAREEDESAIVAKRPEASTKTFVGKPSNGKISGQSSQVLDPKQPLRTKRVESCLSYYLANPESVVERSPWAVMHAMLPFGVEGEIIVGNRRVNSIQWMCYNGTCRTQKLFTPAGRYFRPNVGGGVQGHEGQFLAMLAQSQVSASYPIVVGQNKYSVTDLIRYEMATCREKDELTFKLIGLSYYIDTEQIWLTDKRNRWNIGKLVQEELAQPINGAACGGTHRLMGLTFAVKQRKAEGRPIDGHFARADRYVKDFVDYAWKLQNPDGSFSTNWFESRGNDSNMERKVQTTGHILEWLAFTVSDDELGSARFAKSIDFLLSQIWDQRQNKWPIGPRGHATRAIALYHQRTSGIAPGQRHSQMAEQIQSLRTVR